MIAARENYTGTWEQYCSVNIHFRVLSNCNKYFSMESVDQVGRRERFMQSNFESLSGGDDNSLPPSMTNSISNAWREGASSSNSAHQRNAGTIG